MHGRSPLRGGICQSALPCLAISVVLLHHYHTLAVASCAREGRQLLASRDRPRLQLPPRAAEIVDCYTTQGCGVVETKWSSFLRDKPSCLRPYHIWWSTRKPAVNVTLVTQLSADRLPQIKAQCATWSGILAAALYVPLVNVSNGILSNGQQQRLQMHATAIDELVSLSEHPQNKRLHCSFRLMLVYESVSNDQVAVLYPVNSLRNLARLMADTELIANIDVDMLPSASMSAALQDPKRLQQYTKGTRDNNVYVIPAFETRCGGPSYADSLATMIKQGLHEHIARDCLGAMRGKVAVACHGPTDFGRWFNTTQPYDIQYAAHFEPWFLSHRLTTRWFDARYRGYGKNKIVQAAYSNHTGVGFRVFVDGFLVHRYHTDSKARKQFISQKYSRKTWIRLKGTVFEHIETLWNQTLIDFAERSYRPLLEPALLNCVQKLDFWQPSPPI